MSAVGLDWMFDDPKWSSVPEFDDVDQRVEYYELLLAAVRAKTAAEWQEVFDREPDVWAEIFRHGSELLDHPQMQHDRSVVTVDDPALGRSASRDRWSGSPPRPGLADRSAPALDAHGADAACRRPARGPAASRTRPRTPTPPPLAGVTVVELGTYYAAPYGATLLTDLGARVIKVEQLDGDPIRHIIPFPEVGAVKVLQGKECVAVDIHTDDGRAIVHELVRHADAVLVSFRAGVVERHGSRRRDAAGRQPRPRVPERAGLRRRRSVRPPARVRAHHRCRRRPRDAQHRRPSPTVPISTSTW